MKPLKLKRRRRDLARIVIARKLFSGCWIWRLRLVLFTYLRVREGANWKPMSNFVSSLRLQDLLIPQTDVFYA
jgi:hypothetical protein